MTLLFDENLSFRLVEQLADVYPHRLHVRDVGLIGQPDEEIWRYAGRQHCAIVTKDIDFYQRSMLRGAPPKVIWVRIGNATTCAIPDVLRSRFPSVQHFIAESDAAFLDRTPRLIVPWFLIFDRPPFPYIRPQELPKRLLAARPHGAQAASSDSKPVTTRLAVLAAVKWLCRNIEGRVP